MIEVKNLQKAFGGNMVLKGVTETIEKGEKIAIIGPCLLYTSDAADE